MTRKKVIVVGGGAAGLMAAGQAAEQGAKVVLLEKMTRPGRKLRITGKGRCNLTNVAELREFIDHFGRNGRFLRQAFSRFFSQDLIDFINELGVKTVLERGGRVFPESNQAGEVVDALEAWLARNGVEVRCCAKVEKLLVEENRVIEVHTLDTRTAALSRIAGDAVIITTGGASYPLTGSTGDGYALAKSMDHKVTEIRPALIPLKIKGQVCASLEGLSLRNISAKLWLDGKKKADQFGDMVFTGNGVSGPVILTLSRQAVDAHRAGKKVALSIDLKPALDEAKLEKRLISDLEKLGKRKFKTILKELLPKKLIPVCIELMGIPEDKAGHHITAEERKKLRVWLKHFPLEVTGHQPIAEAIVTAGGVHLKEIDPYTMASRLVENLYFAGEVLDVDGDTGGYNLQAAFSTGWLAGRSAAG